MPKKLFWMTVIFYILHQLIKQPHWVLGGEMWAEMATNYFHYARSPSFFEKIFATDAGYIPAPQRLIALIGYYLHLPASYIPYFYTWTAIILTGMMVGTFCLEPFRKVIPSDALRFLVGVVVLWAIDFETRTFVNFTYLGGYFAALITALAFTHRENEQVPWWAWCLPILMVSKPAVLAALPAMVVVAIVKKDIRFRFITAISFLFCLGQIVQICSSHKAGAAPYQAATTVVYAQLMATVEYFVGFLGSFIFGLKKNPVYDHALQLAAGLFILGCCGYVLFKKRDGTQALIIVGLSLLFFNVLINCFALTGNWDTSLTLLDGRNIYRHIIIGLQGCILITAALVATLSDAKLFKTKYLTPKQIAVLIFCAWFFASSLYSRGRQISKERNSTGIYNSQWQLMANKIDADEPRLCVPIDPIGWTYPSHCALLPDNVNWSNAIHFTQLSSIVPPENLNAATLTALAILIKPQEEKSTFIHLNVAIKLKNGKTQIYGAERRVDKTGSMMYVEMTDDIAIHAISSISLDFNEPTDVAVNSNTDVPVMIWMGY